MKAAMAPAFFAACLAAGVTGSATGAAGVAEVASVRAQEPRAFGYSVGDVVVRVVTVEVPAGLELEEASLPDSTQRGRAIELRRVSHSSEWQPAGRRHRLTLEYQVLLSPPEVRTLELPPVVLRLVPSSSGRGAAREQELRVDAWPVTVSPLTPPEARNREGLGEWRPDEPPPLLDTRGARSRLFAYGVVVALLLAYLAFVYLWLPWWSPRRRPFGVAWRSLRHLGSQPQAPQRQEAFRRLHKALNQTAGRVVFESDIGAFVAEHPQFAGLRDELAHFFQHSRQQFFGGAALAVETEQGDWLRHFCLACRNAERGAG